MKIKRNIKIAGVMLLILIFSSMLYGCNSVSEETFETDAQPEGSYMYIYSIQNEEEDIDGDLTFRYTVHDDGTTKLQTMADLDTWIYKAEIIFETSSLKPLKSYKSNEFFSTRDEDWSVQTKYGEQTTVIDAVQGDKTASKKVNTPDQYLDNEMINLSLGFVKIENGEQKVINVLINESAVFAPYAVKLEKIEEITVHGNTYECRKYTVKYAGFSLFSAKESYLWYTNDDMRVLVKYESGSQIMMLKEIIAVDADYEWLFER